MGFHAVKKLNSRFARNNSLFTRTLFRMMPLILLSGISTFLLTTVDGLVVGNTDGAEALAAVSAMGPFLTIIGAVTAVVHSGVSIVFPQLEGQNCREKRYAGYKAAFFATILIAAVVAVIQIPVAALIIKSMGFTPEVSREAWAYSIGLFLSNPIDCISTVGTFVLVATGNAGFLLGLSIVEGAVDVGIDFLLVVVFHLGPFGAGIGTAAGIWIRCIITIVLIHTKTDFFKFGKEKCKDVAMRMLHSGFPAGISCIINALMTWILSWLIMNALGVDGMSVKAVLSFISSLSSILLSAILKSAVTIIGFRNGVQDYHGVNLCFKTTMGITAILMTVLALVGILFPQMSFALYGIHQVPAYGDFAVRIFALALPFSGCNAIAYYYFQLRHKNARVAVFKFLEDLLIPLVAAFGLRFLLGPDYLWIGYASGSVVMFFVNLVLVIRSMPGEAMEAKDTRTLSLSLTREDANEASEKIGRALADWNLSASVTNRLSVIIEEVTAYSQVRNTESGIRTDLLITSSKEGVKVVTIDDGKKITELEDAHIKEKSQSDFTNYDLLKSIAKELTYQRIMNTNVITATL